MAALVDTNVLVYRFDLRFPARQACAIELLRQGIKANSLCVPYQALLEFVAATTRPLASQSPSLLTAEEARREVEDMLVQFAVLYPDEELLRTAIRGAATYGLSWFDASIWAYAERYSLDTIWSEDFDHTRLYGRVRVQNPFAK